MTNDDAFEKRVRDFQKKCRKVYVGLGVKKRRDMWGPRKKRGKS